MERIAKLGPPIYILYRSACLIQNYHHRHVECKWQLCAKMLIVKYQHLHRVVLSGNERCESDGVDVSASISEEPPLCIFLQSVQCNPGKQYSRVQEDA